MKKERKTTAHRGVSSLAPENTMAAFKLVKEHGSQWIEIDVQLSADGVPMVIHDRTVNRCTNGRGSVREMSVSQLKMLDAGGWFDDRYVDERIPTLEETLLYVKEAGLHLNIELKVYPEDNVIALCDKVKEVVEKSEIPLPQVLFSSFDNEALYQMMLTLPLIRRGQLWQQIPDEALSLLREIQAYSVHCDYRFLLKQEAELIKEAGYQLYCYTANFPELVEKHWQWGVDMMITDDPKAYALTLET
ncbi:glycerophosphoryl diester phosphodiesterase [Vibrio breoganii]|uniref:glycerophosphoryl diester phosphodiesterase n=1 Tax=Vibrio breoganii TaxID=553239 RepID=UPI000C817799|nr:glycerophosphoryl diester phosphodiesterase [Vibrio breoganii]PMI24254.1 glycerophosphoryl diester phosphodiesterase [Vibrio breoganii]PMK60667.1 glycerophosphoryl diester phosphodiesterase [Vibrio breoganii]PMK66510.1 glycerophosphoryl diester phosphodiesterase [Vibrio breoganii]PMM14443.1 glycerophosphoryl diester phosphodiesterase [Vibrio breoganii]